MSDYPTVAFNLGVGYIDDAKVNEVAEKVEAMQKDVTDLNAKSLPANDGETGMNFLARIDAYDLLTDAEGNYIADDEGKPMYGAVYDLAPEAIALAEKAEMAAKKAQKTADEANTAAKTAQTTANVARSVANTAQNTASAAQTTANMAATKSNPVFTGSFSQNRKSGTTVGTYSHAEGRLSTASGNYSHAEGYMTTATGENSHSEGDATSAFGSCSHAEGSDTSAIGIYSHAEGFHTTASSPRQHVQGMYNIQDVYGKYAHIVGNGSSTKASNAHTLDWNGNAWYAGTVECTSIILSGTNSSGEDKKFMLAIAGGSLEISEVVE